MRKNRVLKIAVAFVVTVSVMLIMIAQSLLQTAGEALDLAALNPNGYIRLSQQISDLLQMKIGGEATRASCATVDTPATGSSPKAPAAADLIEAVSAEAQTNYEALVALGASWLETTWNNDAVGGGAYGYWQIQNPGVVHPDITVEQAKTPSYAIWYMFNVISPNFRDGIRNVDPNLWKTNPTLAMETAIFNTEQPGTWYHISQGQARVDEAFQMALAKLPEMGFSADLSTQTPKGGATATNVAATTAPNGAGAAIAAQTKDQQLEQHLFVGVPDAATAQSILSAHPYIGGFFLISSGSPARVSDDLKQAIPALTSSARIPLFIATDQEYTDSVDSFGLADGKKASDLAGMSDDDVQAAGAAMGKSLSSQGVNMDFAPVVDLQVDSNPIIGAYNRGISSDPAVVTAKATAFAKGLNSEHVTPVIKHYPGHGNSTGDSHVTLPQTPPLSTIEDSDMLPFGDVPKNTSTAVMVGHLDVPGLTNGAPASQSPEAYNYLRTNLGFNGLIITDELGGMVGAGTGSLGDRISGALNAGADMALFNVSSSGEFEQDFTEAKDKVVNTDDTSIVNAKNNMGLNSVAQAALQNCQVGMQTAIMQMLGLLAADDPVLALQLNAQITGQFTDARNAEINAAQKYIGTTYAWGGGTINGPSQGIYDGGVADSYGDYNKIGFDCSGLVLYALYQATGKELPHYTVDQWNLLQNYRTNSPQPGDLVYFGNPKIHHVGIYIGPDKMLNAPQSGDVVKVSAISDHSDLAGYADPFAWAAAQH